MAAVDKWNERYAGSELVWSKSANKEFVNQATGLAPGRALDLGSGEGRNAIWLAEQGWQVTAVDFSQAGTDKGQQLAGGSAKSDLEIDWVVSDACDYNDESGFDLVAVLYLHTTKAERDRWLPNAIKMVRPGGSFIYIGHDLDNIEQGVGGPQVPEVLPNAAEITPLLGGFDISYAGIIERHIATETGHGTGGEGKVALDCLINAVREKN